VAAVAKPLELTFTRRFPALIVKQGTLAEAVLRRLILNGPIEPGRVYFVSEAEFGSLMHDVAAFGMTDDGG
jgi:hypothetical protein